jgi:Protein of unknown function (DUF3224)
MRTSSGVTTVLLSILVGGAMIVTAATHGISLASRTTQKGNTMSNHATGAFEVKIVPIDPAFKSEADALGRMSIDKQFHGELEATSKGEMLTGMTPTKGSAGYVAMERVTGTLKGRNGTFILQHSGTMNRGVPTLSVTVVPDSGTGELAGLTGSMNILITEGKHSYDFTYTLPDYN